MSKGLNTMDMQTALTEFSYAKDWTPSSKAWYRSRLGAFTTWLTEQDITDIGAIDAPLVRRYVEYRRTAPSKHGTPLDSHTLHGHVRAIRALLNWAASEDLIDERVPKRVALPKREQKVLGIFTQAQTDALTKACDTSETPERDRAILALLADTGMRAAELTSLTLDAVHFEEDGAYLKLRGKGRKEREVPLGRTARKLLHGYIHRSRPASDTSTALFLAKGGAALTPGGLDQLLYRLRDRASVSGVRCSAHTFRHTHAVRSLEAGQDVYRLSRLMGHSTVSTTEGYLKAFSARAARTGGVSVLDMATRTR
jgi:integrase/recombinase XerD